MSGRVAGKVAFVSGAARGQGRSHALTLAAEGADIIALDICADIPTLSYGLGTEEDLQETAKGIEALDRRVVCVRADVRDEESVRAGLDAAVAELGRLDVIVANAGVCTAQTWDEVTPQIWRDVLETDLVGMWNTIVAGLPHLISAGGGSVVCIGSTAGIKGQPFLTPYVAAKHGVVGLARSLANELASHSIRVNVVHPAGVQTPMLEAIPLRSILEANDDPKISTIYMNALPIRTVGPIDVSNAVVYLASEEARYVTGLELKVDGGYGVR